MFKYLTYAQAADLMISLQHQHPNLVQLYTAQERFGLPTAGTCAAGTTPCLNHVIEVTNRAAPRGNASAAARPEIYISGALHGDEAVGVATALELVRWLVTRYAFDPWVRRLVDTRVLVVTPMTNAVGYERSMRYELDVDPNRDFPYEQRPHACMGSVAARTVNELYRTHLFSLALTFHGGMQALGYAWGAPSYFNYRTRRSQPTPDKLALHAIGSAMSSWAGSGSVRANERYKVGSMNELVYPVYGGMEDWSYGGSWNPTHVTPCTPKQNGGYALAKTRYDDAVLRVPMFLVETSDRKRPPEAELGAEGGVYAPDSSADGHVPRNMRLALVALDVAAPHVAVAASGSSASTADGPCLALEWQVWGAFSVDESAAMWRPSAAADWRPLPFVRADWLRAGAGAGSPQLTGGVYVGGNGVWGAPSPDPSRPSTLVGCVRIPEAASRYELAIAARVDSAWGQVPAGASSEKAQSHLVQSRVNASYVSANGEHLVQGQSRWISEPLQIECGQNNNCCVVGDRRCAHTSGPG